MGFGSLPRSDSFARLRKEGVKRLKMLHFGREPTEIDLSVLQEPEFAVSKEYVVQCQLMATSDECANSPIIGGFPAGTYVTILHIGGTCRGNCRLQVTNKSGTLEGWVSSMWAGEPSLRKSDRKILDFSFLRTNSRRRSRSVSSLTEISPSVTRPCNQTVLACRSKADCGLQPSKNLEIGDTLQTEGKIIVRETESMSSPKIVVVKAGCQMQILDFGKTFKDRVKVLVDGTIGWVTILHTNLHEPLFAKRPHTF